jgi:hypothetical protein
MSQICSLLNNFRSTALTLVGEIFLRFVWYPQSRLLNPNTLTVKSNLKFSTHSLIYESLTTFHKTGYRDYNQNLFLHVM